MFPLRGDELARLTGAELAPIASARLSGDRRRGRDRGGSSWRRRGAPQLPPTPRSRSIAAAVLSSGPSSDCLISSTLTLRRLHREVDRGDDAAAAVADRRGDRAQARLELLVDDRVALLAHAVELRLELPRVS